MPNSAAAELRAEAIRKLLHLMVSAVPVLYARGLERRVLLPILGVCFAFAVLVEIARQRSPAIEKAFESAVGTLLREHERYSLTGATWLLATGLLALLVFERRPAIAALWCATVGDSAAALVGRSTAYFRAKQLRSGRTLIGSISCAAASFAGVWLLAGYTPISALAVATGAAIAERLAGRLDDNAMVTVTAGALAALLT